MTVLDSVGQAASKAASGVGSALATARDRAGSAVAAAPAAGDPQPEEAKESGRYQGVRQHLVDFFEERRMAVAHLREAGFGRRALLKGAKTEALDRLVSLSKPIRSRVLMALRESMKDVALADPDMWSSARLRIASLIDHFWDDLTVYVESVVVDAKDQMLSRAADHAVLENFGSKPCCLGLPWLRARLLYGYLPFDISIFGQIKRPGFWILTLLSITPTYGVRVIFFAILLLCILGGNPPDEYQMVTFILSFKGAQFLSSGVLMACVAAVKYYMCVKPGGVHTCDTNGPGVSQDLVTSSVDFFGSCVLVWIAFLLLPWTASFGAARDLDEDSGGTEKEEGCCSKYDRGRGGRLARLLGYDLLSFLVSCGLIYYLTIEDISAQDETNLQQVATDKDLLLSDLQNWQFRSRRPRERKARRPAPNFPLGSQRSEGVRWVTNASPKFSHAAAPGRDGRNQPRG
ncbi:unnamed protein product, partial [Effrenium voratum]